MTRSYSVKLLLLVIGLVAAVQLATYFAARKATHDQVLAQARHELRVGGDILSASLKQRAARLMNTVNVLAADFAFKRAVASAEAPTVLSALVNHASRIRADVAMVVNLDGQTIARSHPASMTPHPFPFPRFLDQIKGRHSGVASVVLHGQPYQLVLTTVDAPLPIAWVGMGFRLNSRLAAQMKDTSGLEVSFASTATGHYDHVASTLPQAAALQLLKTLNAQLTDASGVRQFVLGEQGYLAAVRHESSYGGEIAAVLQIPLDEVLAPYYELNQRLLWITLGGLLLACVVAIFLARRIAQPVRELAGAAQRIAQGRYNAPIAVKNKDELGDLARAFNTMQSAISDREERIVYQALHDPLTNLPNRESASNSLSEAITKAHKSGQPVALLLINLNRFREINDGLGHQVGDYILQEVSIRLEEAISDQDVVTRMGADEFLVIMEATNRDQAMAQAGQLLEHINGPMEVGEIRLNMNASVGVCLFPEHGGQAEELIRRAGIALDEAKRRHQFLAVYQPGKDEQQLKTLTILRDLQVAVANDDLQVFYQPKANIQERRTMGVEALVRWEHPEFGFLPPDDFIGPAEQAGTIGLITHWVLERAIIESGVWRQHGLDLVVSVNVSPVDLLDAELPNRVKSLLEHYRMPPERLCLEVTEGAVMRDTRHGVEMLNRLKALGVHLSIDDFGTGYSSLSQLKRMPVDELKIDKSFVLKLDENDDDAVIVRSTIEIGHQMALNIVAEGVETETIWYLLHELGCDIAQGYYLSKPMPPSELLSWVKKFNESATPEKA